MKNMIFLLMVSLAAVSCQRPVTVVQISDPQFRFMTYYTFRLKVYVPHAVSIA